MRLATKSLFRYDFSAALVNAMYALSM